MGGCVRTQGRSCQISFLRGDERQSTRAAATTTAPWISTRSAMRPETHLRLASQRSATVRSWRAAQTARWASRDGRARRRQRMMPPALRRDPAMGMMPPALRRDLAESSSARAARKSRRRRRGLLPPLLEEEDGGASGVSPAVEKLMFGSGAPAGTAVGPRRPETAKTIFLGSKN